MKHLSLLFLLCAGCLHSSAQITITPFLDTLQGKVLSYTEKQYNVDPSKPQSEWRVELEQSMSWNENGTFNSGFSRHTPPRDGGEDIQLLININSLPDGVIRAESISQEGSETMLITLTPTLRRNVYMAGTPDQYTNESKFDENGREISYKSFNQAEEQEFSTETTYDEAGRKTKEVMSDIFDQTTITYTYNEQGLLISSEITNASDNGTFSSKYAYDNQNRLVAIEEFNLEYQLMNNQIYSYSVDGRKTTITSYEYNVLVGMEEITTDELGRIIERTTYPDGLNPLFKIESTYDQNNHVNSTIVTSYWEDGSFEKSTTLYTYDDHGNWIKMENIADYGHFISERTFKYL